MPIRLYNDFAAMVADPDRHVVDITTYPSQHKDAAIAAPRRRHLILEKPLTLNWNACRAVRNEVVATVLGACVCFEVRYSDQFLATKHLIDQDLLG
jgi:UDP-N-acetyl-2-amino-2-deoxyglucuronate dehydrogenase